MNNLDSANLEAAIINIFQKILNEDPNFFLTDRLSVLTWKSKKVEGALVTKVGNIRYLGFLKKDKKGQEYWKYKPLKKLESEQSGSEGSATLSNSPLSNSKPVEKNSPAVGLSSETVSVEERSPDSFCSAEKGLESEQVKKFREKYGTFKSAQEGATDHEPKTNNSVQ